MMKMHHKQYSTLLNQISFGAILLYFLFHISQKNYLLFHSITELSSIIIAWSLFVIVWNTRGIIKNESCVFIGVAYLFIGGLDLLHTLSYKGMGVFPVELGANLPTQLWIVARYMEAGALLFVPFSLSKQIKFSSIFTLFFLVTASGLFAIWWEIFPDCYIEGVGLTEFNKNSEYIIVGLLAATLFFLYLKRNLFEKTVYYFLLLSVTFTLLAELALTFYVSVYGFSNLVGHLCKIVSFYCIYKALIKEVLTNPYSLMSKELSEKEKRYRQIFETNTAVKLIIDPKSGNIVEANKAACNFYGYSEAEIQQLTISDINTLSPEEIGCEMEKAVSEEKLFFNFSHRLSSGAIRDVEVYAGPIEYQQNTYLCSIVHDVTKRNFAKKEALSYAENLQTIFKNIPTILLLINEEERVEMINHKGVTFSGKERVDMLGQLGGEVFDCIHSFKDEGCGRTPECATCPIRNQVMSTFKTGKSQIEVEGKMVFLLGGQEVTYHFIISTALLTINESPAVLLSLSDISTRKQAEKEIQYQAMLLDQISDHITATDLMGNILYVNEAVVESLELKREDILGKSVTVYGDNPAKGESQKEIIKRTLEDGVWHGEVVNYSKDGTEKIMECRTRLLMDSHGNPQSMVGVSTDITQRKQLEDHLQQAQKIESIGSLAGGIAHDFNNLLFPIIGLAEIFLEDFSPDSPEYTNAQQILTAAHRGADLVNQILAFSRQSKTTKIPVRLQTVLREVLKLCKSSIPSNIEIISDIQQDCGTVSADATQIHQIAMNLITNAYHAVDENSGKISVKLEEGVLEEQQQANTHSHPQKYATLSVSDNGVGIEKEVLNKIFDPYFTTKRQGKGTGLGLAVAYGIIQEHNGLIKVFSKVGEGATFTVLLPLLKQKNTIEKDQQIESYQTGNEKILLVDDDVAVLQFEKQMLERLGYKVSERSSSADALKAFKVRPQDYDIVISDLAMPNITGDRLAKEILMIRPDIPIIICTGFSERFGAEKAMKIGVKGFLMKPVTKLDFSTEVRRVIDMQLNKEK